MINLICEDAVGALAALNSNSIELVITSPPYDNLRDYGNTLEWNETIWELIIAELYYIVKPGGRVVWITQDQTVQGSKTGSSFRQCLFAQSVGFNIDTMIWEKQTATDTGSLRVRYGSVFDFMFIWTKGKPRAFNPIRDRTNKFRGHKKAGTIRLPDGTTKPASSIGKLSPDYSARFNIWKINTETSNKNTIHPAQFSEQLAIDHIYSWSNRGDTVLDPFMGSGTVGAVCKKMGRHFVGIDKIRDIFDKAKSRIDSTIEDCMQDYNPHMTISKEVEAVIAGIPD